MNDTPQDKDPKRKTQEQAILRDVNPGEPSPDRAPFMLTKPDDTPPQGDDMPEPTLDDIHRRVNALESHRTWIDGRVNRHEERIDGHDTRIDSFMTPTQLSAMMDDKFRLQYQTIDEAYARAEKLVGELTSQFAANITAQHNILVQMKTIQDDGNGRNALLNNLVSTVSIWAGYDIKDPQARKIGSSVFEMAKEAVDKAQITEVEMANMRLDVSGMVGQIQGWLPETKAIKEQLARQAENDRIQAEAMQKLADERAETERRKRFVLDLATKVLKSKWATGIILSAVTGIGTLGVFGEQIATFFRILLTGSG